MRVVILAGGYGTRISEESHLKPKPMIEIGGRPILWHIMKYYSSFGHNEFVICCGYKGYVIKEFFADYYLHTSDVTFDFTSNNEMTIHNNIAEPWKVTIVDTGLNTMTGGRLKRVAKYIGDEPFLMTYGDGVCDVDLDALVKYHYASGKLATLTAIQPNEKFGVLGMDKNNCITSFREKQSNVATWINGGYFVLDSKVLGLIDDDTCVFEKKPLEQLSASGQLKAYKHDGFWQCMDTLRDKQHLDSLIEKGEAPWIKW